MGKLGGPFGHQQNAPVSHPPSVMEKGTHRKGSMSQESSRKRGRRGKEPVGLLTPDLDLLEMHTKQTLKKLESPKKEKVTLCSVSLPPS
ncbi:hypothetical protein chiPu_0028279, partial [Chiloscyllium punctatum]|nr:hypothetical protein [Chiloscyllium punctatum]